MSRHLAYRVVMALVKLGVITDEDVPRVMPEVQRAILDWFLAEVK